MRGFSDSDRSKPLTTYSVNGQTIDIFINGEGTFFAELDDNPYKAPTLDALRAKLRQAGREKAMRIEIKATRIVRGRYDDDATELRDVLLTGVHARNRSILYRDIATGRADHEDSYRNNFFRLLTEEEKAEVLASYKAVREAQKVNERLIKRFEIDARATIEKAIEKEKAALPPDEETGDPRVDPPKKRRR